MRMRMRMNEDQRKVKDLVGEEPKFELVLVKAVSQSSDRDVASIFVVKSSCFKIKENVVQSVLRLHVSQFLENGHGLLSKRRVLGVVGQVQELELERGDL